jgi:hypothetical protein
MENVKNICENTRQLLEEKFGNIQFIEEGHEYFIENEKYTPVSTVISEYEQPFEEDKVAENYARKNHRTKADVLKEWKFKNLKSTIGGSRVHEFGESYTNMVAGFPEKICEANRKQYVDCRGEMMLIPTFPKECAVKKFYDEKSGYLTPVGAEFKLSTRYMGDKVRKICGTCDLLFYEEDPLFGEHQFVLADWKTNASLTNDYKRKNGICMKFPFDNMIDDALSHYTLQFNLYRRMLESVGVKIGDMRLIWLKEDGDYEIIKIGKLNDSILDRVLSK